MKRQRTAAALCASCALCVLAAGCAVFAPEKRPAVPPDTPKAFSESSAGTPAAADRWWTSFHAPELDALIEESLTNSPTIRQAWARLAQAEAIARQAGAPKWPWLDLSGQATRSKNSITYQSSDLFSLGLNASYEVDLWGRIHSLAEAAALDREASREALQTAAVTLSAQVALRWSGVIAQRLQTELIRRQLEANRTMLELVELRFRKSLATALDVYQQRQAVAGTASLLPQAEMREKLLRHELAALLGRADPNSVAVRTEQLPEIGPPPATGLPAEVLTNRPDVRAAWLRLRAADWRVSAAKADRLPALRLTASGNYSNPEFSNLLDDWYANLAAGILGPIFEGGRRKAEVDRRRAVVAERLADYRQTVITAVKEVEDALVSEQRQREYVERVEKRVEAARRSHEEALNRYRNGLVPYTTVLLQLNALQAAERELVTARYDLIRYRVALYRALGGTRLPAETRPAAER